jgi:hypothetical protein
LSNQLATHEGNTWNYNFNNTLGLGTYTIYGYSSNGTTNYDEYFIGNFEVTSTGIKNNDKIPIYLLAFSLIIVTLGFIFKSPPVGFFSGILFIITGTYLMIYGFGDIADLYTRAFAFIVIAFGLLMTFIGIMSFFDEDD